MAEDLRIEQGTITVCSDAARALIAAAAGKWRLTIGAPELLFLLRERPQSLAAELEKLEPGAPVFAGDLAQLPPGDLLNFLHQGRRTGVLFVRSGEVERGIVLLEGNVAWACSTSPGERLGELVCRMGLVPRAALDMALATQAQEHSHRRLGQMLEERGLLAPEALARALRHQVVEIFLGLLVLRSGAFLFLAGVTRERLPAELMLDTEALLLDGLRRLDEMEYYRARIPSALAVLIAIARPEEPLGFTAEMTRLFERVDGVLPLSVLSEATALGEFEATKAAFKLVEGGWVEVDREASAGAPDGSAGAAPPGAPDLGT